MSQQNRTKSDQLPKAAAANKPIDKSRLDINEIQKMNPNEQKALLAELEQELKAETVQEAAPLLEFVLKHIKTLIALIIVAIIAISIWGFWQWKNENTQQALTKEFQKIVYIQNPEQKIKALEEFSKDAPQNLQIAINLEEANMAMLSHNYALAVTNLEEAIALDDNSPLSLALNLALADVLLKDNKAQEALKIMEEYLTVVPENLYTAALEEVAVIAETLGDNEKAITTYKELLEKAEENSTAKSFYLSRISQLSK